MNIFLWHKKHTSKALQGVDFTILQGLIGSNTSISRNSAINIPLTIRFNARSLRSYSTFSIQGPIYGLDFPFPSGSIDQTAHLGFFKVDITTDGNQYLQLQCKNYGHYSPDWPLLHLSVVGISWFGKVFISPQDQIPLTVSAVKCMLSGGINLVI